MSLNKCTHLLFVIITAVIINLTVVSTAYAAADPVYNPKPSKLPDFRKVAKDILRNPTKVRKYVNPWALAGQVALDTLVNQVGKLIDSAGEVQYKDKNGQPVDADHPEAEASGYSRTDSNHPGAYPYEFTFYGESFGSAEAAHHYAITGFLTKQGLKRTRRADGLYYDSLNVYLGNRKYGGIGYFVVEVNAADSRFDYEHNIAGGVYSFVGEIYYKGTLSNKTVDVTAEELLKQLEDLLKNTYRDGQSVTQPADEAAAKEEAKSDSKKDKDKKDKKDEFKLEFPRFCEWATPVCDFVDWFKKEPELPELPKPEFIEDDKSWLAPAERNWVSFGSTTCPQDIVIPIQFGNNSQNITISYVPFCRFASMIKPAVILGAYLSALMIIVGGRQREG